MRYTAFGMAALLCATMPLTAAAQSYSDLRRSASPLVLRAQGSFYVGGEVVEQSFVERGSFGPPGPGHLTIHQMYVEYMIPASHRHSAPVVMVHGMGLSGKTWETTPDGRMGWDEYFVRRGHASYVIDQVSRARSGFNQAIYNNVRAGLLPPGSQPPMRRFSDEMGWGNFRFGTGPGAPFPDEQFPVEFLDELAKQNVPDLNGTLPTPNPTYRALATLATVGMTPHQYVLRTRIQEAKNLLATHRLAIAEIAVSLGFASQSHFTEVFRRVVGTTPARYRHRH